MRTYSGREIGRRICAKAAVFIALALSITAKGDQLPGGSPTSFSIGSSGSVNYSYDIIEPTTAGGVVPDLSIDYSGSQQNGLLGVGWSLSGLPSIVRCTPSRGSKGDPLYADQHSANSRLCLVGNSNLSSTAADSTSSANPGTTTASTASGSSSSGMGGRLKLVSGTYGRTGSEYRLETDPTVKIKVISHIPNQNGGYGPSVIKVWTGSGMVYTYRC